MKTENNFLSRRFIMMISGIIILSISCSSFRLCELGTDAFTCMNLGISGFLNMQFGTWQLIWNTAVFIIVFFTARHCIGIGTLFNMVFIGYISDFICWGITDVMKVRMTLPLKVLALAIAIITVSIGASLYMVADLGVSPYDALAIIAEEKSRGKIQFGKARIATDAAAIIIGTVFCLLSGGNLWLIIGAGTILSACLNGPLIQFCITHLAKPMLKTAGHSAPAR